MNPSALPFLVTLEDDAGSLSSSSTGFHDSKDLSGDSISNVECTLVMIEDTASTGGTQKIASGDGFFAVSMDGTEDHQGQESGISSLQKGRLVLLVLAMVYGSLNVSTRLVFSRTDPPDASVSSAIQGWFSVLCFFPLLWGKHRVRHENNGPPRVASDADKARTEGILTPKPNGKTILQPPGFWRFAMELALIDFGTQTLTNMGLKTTPGARASFLIQTSVVCTPVVSVLLGKQRVHKRVWFACFVALAGLFILSQEQQPSLEQQPWDDTCGAECGHPIDLVGNCTRMNVANPYCPRDSDLFVSSPGFTKGDWSCLFAALCWSLYIYRMSVWADSFDETITQFVKNSAVTFSYTLWMLVSLFYKDEAHADDGDNLRLDSPSWLWKTCKDPVVWIILFYNALGPCTIADVCQQSAQAFVPAAETNVILSLEPVFATLLGFLVLGETPSLRESVGGVFIIAASIIASCGSDEPRAPPSHSSPQVSVR